MESTCPNRRWADNSCRRMGRGYAMHGLHAPRAGAGCSAPDPAPARRPGSCDDREPNVPTSFQSILYPCVISGTPTEETSEPDFAGDLNLDQIVAAVTTGYDECDLKPFFYRRLDDPDQVRLSPRGHAENLEKSRGEGTNQGIPGGNANDETLTSASENVRYVAKGSVLSSRLPASTPRRPTGSPAILPSCRWARAALPHFAGTCRPMSYRRHSANWSPISAD